MDILIIGLFAITIAWFWYLYTLSKRDNPNIRDSINENVEVEPITVKDVYPSTEAPVVTTEVATEAPVVTTKKTTKKVAAVKAPAKAPAKRQYTKKPKA
jgi:hypothetical protein